MPLQRCATASDACSCSSNSTSSRCVRSTSCLRCSILQTQSQRQRVDEHAEDPPGARISLQPSEQHAAEHDVVATARTCHDQGPCRVEQRRRAYTERAAPARARVGQARARLVRCDSTSRLPSPCTSSRPNGAVGSSMSPSLARKNPAKSCLLRVRQRLCDMLAVRHRLRQLLRPPFELRHDLLNR